MSRKKENLDLGGEISVEPPKTGSSKVFEIIDKVRRDHDSGKPYPKDPEEEHFGENPGDVPGQVLIKKEGDFSRLLKTANENKKTVIFVGSAILFGALGLAIIGKKEHLKNLSSFGKKPTPKS